MKNIKWSSLFIGLICLCSCVDLTELNENPTKATSISPHLLIPTIQLTHSQYMQNTIRYFIYPGAFVNHWIGGWSMHLLLGIDPALRRKSQKEHCLYGTPLGSLLSRYH